jgi:acetylglutamate kinase
VVVKIGGSTLGQHDTTLDDLAALQREGGRAVVVHGGGNSVSAWLKRLDLPSRFVRGLRVTDAAALEVVVAVLAGLVNKQLVADLGARGVPAVGVCGADGGLIAAMVEEPGLGRVGAVRAVDTGLLSALTGAGYLPVIAPIGWTKDDGAGGLLNINADTVAGEIAAALGARALVFLTDVPAVLGADGAPLAALDADEAAALIAGGTITAGMIPKVEACRRATAGGGVARIVDGRVAGALTAALNGSGECGGTLFLPTAAPVG